MKKKRKAVEINQEPSTSINSKSPTEETTTTEMSRKSKRKRKGVSKGDNRTHTKPCSSANGQANGQQENPYEYCEVTVLKNFGDIKTKDIQTLALHYLGCSQYLPEWCMVSNRGSGHSVCVIMIEALYPFVYKTLGAVHMPNFAALFPEGPVPIQNPGSDLFVTPASSAVLEKEPRKRSSDSASKNGESSKKLPPVEEYVLSKDHMLAHEYPAEDIVEKEPSVWTRFKGNSAVEAKPHQLYAIDCEMCKTAAGSELTQIAIVDETLDCIYKTYVKPPNPIVDYLTAFSGITAEVLQGVTTTLEDVVAHINTILPQQAIFVGHSLENDLKSLKMFHDRVIDTAIIYSSGKGGSFKPGLRYLAMRHLKAKIQDSNQGHDPAEDAMTCMRLVKVKVRRGPNYGMTQQNPENSISVYLTKNRKTGVFVDKPIVAQQHCHGLAQALPAIADEVAVELFTKRLMGKDKFYWLHLYKLEPVYRACTTIHDMINNPTLPAALRFIDEAIGAIYAALPQDTLLCLYSGCSGYWKKPQFNGSDEAMKTLMKNIVRQVRGGLMFLKVKN